MAAAAPDLTLLVPFFEEDGRVDRCLEAARAWAQAHPATALEVLCVDDGSTDDTPFRLAAWARRWPAVRVLTLQRNRGKGAALKAGMAAGVGRTVVFLDADLAVDLTHLEGALDALGAGADVVVGCRNVPGASVRRHQRWPRRFMGRVYLKLARLLLGLRVADVTCGFKGFRREVGQRLFEHAACRRWGFDAEILHLAQRAGCVVREMPVQWFDGEVSAVRLRRDVLGALGELLAVRVRHLWRRVPVPTASPEPADPPASPTPAPEVVTPSLRDG